MHFKAKFGRKKLQQKTWYFHDSSIWKNWILNRNVWELKSFFDINEDNGFLNFKKWLNFIQNKIKSFILRTYVHVYYDNWCCFLYKETLEVLAYWNRSLGTTEVAIVSMWCCGLQCTCIYFPNCSFSSDSHGYFIYNTINNPQEYIRIV